MDMESVPLPRRRRRGNRLAAWLVFGLLGLMMGVVWAAGFASSSATVNTAADADPVFGTASSAAPSSEYSGLVAENTALTIDLDGNWGRIAADTPMFDVDLTGVTGTFFIDVVLANTPDGWSALQLEFVQFNSTCGAVADWSAPDATSVMVVETVDSYATFSGLPGGGSACIGIEATAKANDQSGTFIRSAPGATPTAPEFVAILNRSA